MLTKLKVNNSLSLFIFSTLILGTPFMDFYLSNINRLDIYKTFELIKVYSACLIAIIFFSFTINLFFKKKILNITLFFSFCFYLFFYHYDLKNLIPIVKLNSEIAFIIIFSISLISLYLFKFKNFINTLKIYFLITVIINLFLIISINFSKNKEKEDNKFNKSIISYDVGKINEQNNMYLIILDEATSLENFEKNYKAKIKNDYLKKVNSQGYTYIPNSKSSYNQTELTFTSYFYLDYFLDENSKSYKDTKNFYPQMLRYKYDELPLIKLLNRNNYNFYFFGNTRNKCNIKIITCYNKKNIKNNFFDNEISEIFFIKSPFFAIYNKVKEKVKRGLKIKTWKNDYINNDAIVKFISSTNASIPKNSFFLIHNYYPHAPFVYDENCKEKGQKNIVTEKNAHQAGNNIGYYENYICALKKTLEIISYLDKHDPDAVVIIQADHGHYFSKKKLIKEKMEIFNLVKFPDHCKNFKNNQIDNVNAVRSLLKCGLNLNIELLKQKSFWGPYSTKDKEWGKLNKIIY